MLKLVLVIFVSVIAAPTWAQQTPVHVIVDQHSKHVNFFIAEIAKKAKERPLLVNRIGNGHPIPTAKLYVVIGASALEKLLQQNTGANILTTFVSRERFAEIVAKYPEANKRVSALYMEPSPKNQINLIKNIYKKSVNIGVLYSENSRFFVDELNSITETGVRFTYQYVEKPSDIYRAINRLVEKKIDVLLSVPDSTIYNQSTVRDILIHTYDNGNIGLIGFSKSFVKNGALGATYSDLSHVASDVLDFIDMYEKSTVYPESKYVRNFEIELNENVARTLGITIGVGSIRNKMLTEE